jgi:hypothetical protein
MRSERALLPLYTDPSIRQVRDRLEILTTLINGPSFDPLFRDEVIRIPRGHRVYRWDCVIDRCERVREGALDYCSTHLMEWRQANKRGIGRAAFIAAAEPLGFWEWVHDEACRICPDRPANHNELRLCARHLTRWGYLRRQGREQEETFARWVSEQEPLEGFGGCRVVVCPSLADSPVGLCLGHRNRYLFDGRPGGAAVPKRWWQRFPGNGETVPRLFDDEDRFRAWCANAAAVSWPGQINLRGLRPQVRAEIQWGLFMHGTRKRHSVWRLRGLQGMVNLCRAEEATSLIDLDPDALKFPTGHIVKEMLHELRLVYFSPEDTREAGFLETEQFGVKYAGRGSYIDLTTIPQRWLRDLVWDYSANLLRSPGRARTATAIDTLRRACAELGAFLELEGPAGGHDPRALRVAHMHRFIADQQHREREGLPSLAATATGRASATMSNPIRTVVFNGVRRILRDALESGAAGRLGLAREFATAMRTRAPQPGSRAGRWRTRWPVLSATKATCGCSPTSTIRTIMGCVTSRRPSSSPDGAPMKFSSCAGTASAVTAIWRCSGTIRPKSAPTTPLSASPNAFTNSSPNGSAKPWNGLSHCTDGDPPQRNAPPWPSSQPR